MSEAHYLPILIADDQKDVIDTLKLLLKSEGFACQAVQSPDAAIDLAKKQPFGVAIIDLNYTRDTTSGAEGMDLLGKLRALDADLPVVVMTAWGTVDLAVQAMRLGANDFVEKPWDNHRLMTILRAQLQLGDAKRKSKRLERENELLKTVDADFIGKSPAMKQILEIVLRVAPSEANVLLTGENGTGKSMMAQFIHARSGRSNKTFVKVNMGAIPESLFESEMFGHVKGAFTDAKGDRIGRFELAETGSLFLDEIANMSLSQQAKLLRLLQTGEFSPVGSSKTRRADVRVLAATNADIAREVARGAFREDLLYRLNTVEIRLPPLRDRAEDILVLGRVFLEAKAHRYGKAIGGFAPDAAQALLGHRWPGNVRELEHVIERAVVLAEADTIRLEDLDLRAAREPSVAAVERMTLLDAEAYLIRKALERTSGNVVVAAEALGLSRSALYRRLQALGIKVPE